VRTLEDWFKYLEQQYVDEKERKEEPKPPESQPARPEPSAQAVAPTAAPLVLQKPEESPEQLVASTSPSSPLLEQKPAEPQAEKEVTLPPALEQVQIAETPVPDPADYIFTLRRPASQPVVPTPPAATEEASEPSIASTETEADMPSAPETAEPAPAVAEAPEAVATEAQDEQEQPAPYEEEVTAEPSPQEAATASVRDTITEVEQPPAEKPSRARLVRRAPYTRSVRPVPPPQSIEELWKRVPKHVRLLVELGDDEVTQRYYDRQFKESRQELVERLLNPSLTLEDTARLLGVCPTTVRRYTERGLLNHYRTPGNQRRFRLSDVIAFLEARQQAQEARRGRKR